MFNFIVGILNATGWLSWYFLAGGWAADSPSARIRAILVFLIVSAVSTIGSYIVKTDTNNPITNIWRILEFSAFLSAPFINLFWGDAPLFNKIIGFIVCAFTYCSNYCGKTLSKSFLVKWVGMGFFLAVSISFLGNSMGEYIIGFGFAFALPLGIVLGIKNTFFD